MAKFQETFRLPSSADTARRDPAEVVASRARAAVAWRHDHGSLDDIEYLTVLDALGLVPPDRQAAVDAALRKARTS